MCAWRYRFNVFLSDLRENNIVIRKVRNRQFNTNRDDLYCISTTLHFKHNKELKHAAKELKRITLHRGAALLLILRVVEQNKPMHQVSIFNDYESRIQNPFNAILGFAAQIKTKIKDETINEQVSIINESANNLELS